MFEGYRQILIQLMYTLNREGRDRTNRRNRDNQIIRINAAAGMLIQEAVWLAVE